jgi:DNA-binding LacI/PurR family transcriptional regulator
MPSVNVFRAVRYLCVRRSRQFRLLTRARPLPAYPDPQIPRSPSLETNVRKSSDVATPPKIDIRGVASLARVSIATVSRTINHVPTVDPVLAARVWKAVTELNYFPNTQARALVSGKSRLLGLVVSEITNPFFPELIQEFENIAVARGYEILIGSTNYETKTMELCARRMLERQVDGVAIMTFGIEDFLLDRFAADNIPFVFIDPAPSRPLNSVLAVDYRAGIYEGVQHLAVLGHRNIGFISGPLTAAPRKAARQPSSAASSPPASRPIPTGSSKAITRSTAAAMPCRRSSPSPPGPPPSCAPTT